MREVPKKSSLPEALAKALANPEPAMTLPDHLGFKKGPRGGAILFDRLTGNEHYASDEEKEKYNLPKSGQYFVRKVMREGGKTS